MPAISRTLASRRQFLLNSNAAAGGVLTRSQTSKLIATATAPAILTQTGLAAANSDKLRVGLVGCGGRGTGAAGNALTADPNTVLVAVGDAFPDAANRAIDGLKAQFGDRIQVPEEKRFTGLDAYKKVIDSGVDVVLLASPPGFRPVHLRYAVEQGKHIFCEKPMSTDAPGVRHVMESVRMSKEKKLCLVAGFCWRYDLPRRAFYDQIHDGALGEVKSVYCTYLTGPVKPMQPANQRPAGMSDLEWQLRNWMNFVWLSGDGIVEQCIHSVDKTLWTFRDKPPVKCTATGGRMIPNHEGNIYDHMTIVYEWDNGARGVVAQRQIPGCYNDNSDYVNGTKGNGVSGWSKPTIRGEKNWRYSGDAPDMYTIEHQHLFRAIRSGETINDGDRMATSTLAGIMGRAAAYTGKEVTWEQMLTSNDKLVPDNLTWDMKLPIAPIAIPGRHPLL
jgi:predicted dehydrogenase